AFPRRSRPVTLAPSHRSLWRRGPARPTAGTLGRGGAETSRVDDPEAATIPVCEPLAMRVLLITPENRFIKAFRRGQLNNFAQLTMPSPAGSARPPPRVALVDEYNQAVAPGAPADLVGITCNTPNASHVYALADAFRRRGRAVVLGGPHATLLPEESRQHADAVVVGEAERTWPLVLDD